MTPFEWVALVALAALGITMFLAVTLSAEDR
jgi:hypothetical protein